MLALVAFVFFNFVCLLYFVTRSVHGFILHRFGVRENGRDSQLLSERRLFRAPSCQLSAALRIGALLWENRGKCSS